MHEDKDFSDNFFFERFVKSCRKINLCTSVSFLLLLNTFLQIEK